MNSTVPPRRNHHASGPVWCEHRARSAVVSLITPVPEAGPPYVQWCSLVGTHIACDESCISRGARWTATETAGDGLSRNAYDPVREVVVQIRETIGQTELRPETWVDWANAFAAGIASETRAWRAAEAARGEAAKIGRDTPARRVMLAAEDAAWAAVHAIAGNRSLALECTLRARALLRLAAAIAADDPVASR